MLISVITALALLSLSYLFVVSGAHKLQAPVHFHQILSDYRLVPPKLAVTLAKGLPIVEITVGLTLLVAPLRGAALTGVAILLFTYSLAMAINFVRGRRDIDCGCNGLQHSQNLGVWVLVRNSLLLVLVAGIWQFSPQPNLNAVGWCLALTASALVVLLYQSVNQLRTNNQLRQRISHHG